MSTNRFKLENVYINESKYGFYGSVMKDDKWLPVRLVDGSFPKEKGYHYVEADNLWLDSRNPDKLVYRAKGNVEVVKQPSRTQDELIKGI